MRRASMCFATLCIATLSLCFATLCFATCMLCNVYALQRVCFATQCFATCMLCNVILMCKEGICFAALCFAMFFECAGRGYALQRLCFATFCAVFLAAQFVTTWCVCGRFLSEYPAVRQRMWQLCGREFVKTKGDLFTVPIPLQSLNDLKFGNAVLRRPTHVSRPLSTACPSRCSRTVK